MTLDEINQAQTVLTGEKNGGLLTEDAHEQYRLGERSRGTLVTHLTDAALKNAGIDRGGQTGSFVRHRVMGISLFALESEYLASEAAIAFEIGRFATDEEAPTLDTERGHAPTPYLAAWQS